VFRHSNVFGEIVFERMCVAVFKTPDTKQIGLYWGMHTVNNSPLKRVCLISRRFIATGYWNWAYWYVCIYWHCTLLSSRFPSSHFRFKIFSYIFYKLRRTWSRWMVSIMTNSLVLSKRKRRYGTAVRYTYLKIGELFYFSLPNSPLSRSQPFGDCWDPYPKLVHWST